MIKTEVANFAKALTGFPFDSNLFNDSEGFPLIRIRNLKEGQTDTYYNGDYDKTFIVRKGDLLIGMDGEFNLVEWRGVDALLNQRVMKLIVDEAMASSSYIKYALRKRLKEIEDATPFVTVKHLSHKKVLESKIPLPSLPEQQKIAAILSQVDAAREKRKQANALTEQFLQSTFLTLFGDPVKNEKGWEVKKLETIADTQIGPFGTQLHEEDYVTDGIPLINPKHIVEGSIMPDRKQTITLEKFKTLNNYHLKVGDVIMGRRGEMGRCALITERENGWFCGTGSLFIRPGANIHPQYLIYVMSSNSFIKELENAAQGVTMMNLNLRIINGLAIPLPPLSLQQKFADIVNQTKQLRSKQRQSEQELEQLFQSLLQRYFG
ncbi:MAG: restriction endonuclease subunit S [Bacteroidetes bacterium]|jgi:type I restriction enzyme S subunit|nr:restriction endonuclease subunit S [Bacteroidota bacterium]MBK8659344.1 restriction endonuclease subunit S [Bacteroidota bacterium]